MRLTLFALIVQTISLFQATTVPPIKTVPGSTVTIPSNLAIAKLGHCYKFGTDNTLTEVACVSNDCAWGVLDGTPLRWGPCVAPEPTPAQKPTPPVGSWWVILAETFNHDTPRSAGPYPSKALCMTAMHSLLPDDSRFMTPTQFAQYVADLKKSAADEKERMDAYVAAEIAKLPAKTGTITIPYGYGCEAKREVKDGKFVNNDNPIGLICWGDGVVRNAPPPNALTACTFAEGK